MMPTRTIGFFTCSRKVAQDGFGSAKKLEWTHTNHTALVCRLDNNEPLGTEQTTPLPGVHAP